VPSPVGIGKKKKQSLDETRKEGKTLRRGQGTPKHNTIGPLYLSATPREVEKRHQSPHQKHGGGILRGKQNEGSSGLF